MKQISKTFTIFLFFLGCLFENGTAQKLVVNFEISNYQNDTLIVGNYFGEKQIVKDTLFAKGKGKVEWTPVDRPEQGMYLVLLKPENTFVQFLVNDSETKFSLDFDAKDLLSVKFKGSNENKMFYEYLAFLMRGGGWSGGTRLARKTTVTDASVLRDATEIAGEG